MSYYTSTCVQIVHQDHLNPKWEQKAFKKIIDEARMDAEPLSCNQSADDADFNDFNGRAVETVIEMSKKYPSLLLELHGSGEENDDVWTMRVRNGKTERVEAQVVYPVFKDLLSSKERKAAHWKAYRRHKSGDASLYDRRVAKALRLLQDLEQHPPKCNLMNNSGGRALSYTKVDLSPAIELLEKIKRNMF